MTILEDSPMPLSKTSRHVPKQFVNNAKVRYRMVPVLFTVISFYEICMAPWVPVPYIVLIAHWTRES